MQLHNKMSEESTNTNEIYTYLAIPVDILKTNVEHNTQSFTITPNLVIKGLNNDSVAAHGGVLDSLSKNNEKNNFVKFLNLSPKTGEKLAELLQSSLNKSSTNDNQSSVCTKKSTILKPKSGNVVSAKSQEDHLNPKKPIIKNTFISNKSTILKCDICKEVFNQRNAFRNHMKVHLEVKKYKCEHCSVSYNLEFNLKIHMAMHNKGQPCCPICNRKFIRLASLKSHLVNHQMEEIFTCSECLREFEHEHQFMLHMKTHQQKENNRDDGDNEELPATCSFCTRSFVDADLYKEHILQHIEMKQLITNRKRSNNRWSKLNNRYTCNVCKKSFSKYCFLERHMRIHTGEKPFACHFCKSAFNQKGTLQIHLLRHTGLKPFACVLCSAKFFQKSNLRTHVQKTHTVSEQNPTVYKCTFCTCVFKRLSSLSSHITRTHVGENRPQGIFTEVMEQLKDLQNKLGLMPVQQDVQECNILEPVNEIIEEPIDSYGVIKRMELADISCGDSVRVFSVNKRKLGVQQWYICNYCSREFKKPSDLIRHIRVHTKEKPFKCVHCGLAFTVKSTLTNHLGTHYRSKSFKCVICMKVFTTLKILNVHIKKHEKILVKNGNEYTCKICNATFNDIEEVKLHIVEHRVNKRLKHENVPSKPVGIEVIMQQPMIETAEGLFPISAPKSSTNYTEEDLIKRKFKCDQCKSAFFKKIHLTRHILIHSQNRKYRCSSCPKTFYSSYALKEHSKFHSGQRNYECFECGKRFITNGILKRHLLVHSLYKPYVCPYCKMHFKTAAFCRKHINVHKKDINLEVHALNETGEIDDLFNGQETVNEEYLLNNESTELQNITLENLSANTQLPEEIDSCKATKVLFTDENGITVTAAINDDEITQTNYDIIETTNTASYTTDLVVSGNGNAFDSLINTQSFMQVNTENGYPIIYVNCEDLRALSSFTFFNTEFTEKGTDRFLNGGNDIPDTKILVVEDDGTYVNTQKSSEDNSAPYTITLALPKDVIYPRSFVDSVPIADINCLPVKEMAKHDTVIDKETVLKFNKAVELSGEENSACAKETNSKKIEQKTDLLESTSAQIKLETSYTCTQCKKSFTLMDALAVHDCQVYNTNIDEPEIIDGKYKCDFCNKAFATLNVYKRHALTHKKKCPLTKTCSYCQRVFKKRCDLVRHIRIHTGEKPYKCEKCEKCFSLKSTLNCHYRIHDPNSKKDYTCPVCGANFSFRSSLKVHSTIHTGTMPYQCPVCLETFRTSGNRKNHMAVHIKQGESRKSSRSKKAKINNLLASVAMYSQTNEKLAFSQEITSNDNLKTSNDKDPRDISTEVADKEVIFSLPNQPDETSESLLLHLNNMLFQTGVEKLQSHAEINIVEHEDTLNAKQTVDDWISSNEVARDAASLQEELVQPIVNNISKNFECDICHKSYRRKYVLKKHKETHIPKCTTCNINFDSKESHENHVKLHNTCRSFPCHLCANSFYLEKNLKVHLKRIHDVVII